MMKVMENHTVKEVWDAIHTLSDIRAGLNCFDPYDIEGPLYDLINMIADFVAGGQDNH